MARVDLNRLAAARAAERLDHATFERAAAVLAESPPDAVWRDLLERSALYLGAVFAVTGIVFLVAWNWALLGYGVKLGLSGGTVLLAGGLGLRLGAAQVAGRVAMGAAGVLCGPVLVVYSQAYQTGADPWELFATWLLLVLPWALASRLQGVWLLGVILAQVTVITWWVDNLVDGVEPIVGLFLALAGVNAATVALAERVGGGRLVPRVAAGLGFVALLLPAGFALVEPDESLLAWVAYALVFVGVGVIQGVYWARGRDPVVVATSLAATITLVSSTLARVVSELDSELLLTGVVGTALVAQAIAAVLWVRGGVQRHRDADVRDRIIGELRQEGVQWG